MLFEAGHGTAPDLVYARGVPDTPSPNPPAFDKKMCSLIIVEIGFCRDIGCEDKIEEKNMKYAPLMATLRRHWGRLELIALPIGHAGTTLSITLDQLTTAFSTVRPTTGRSSSNKSGTPAATDQNAKNHDYTMFKSLLDSITDFTRTSIYVYIPNQILGFYSTVPYRNSRTVPYRNCTVSYRNCTVSVLIFIVSFSSLLT